jgi:hypothetical protein
MSTLGIKVTPSLIVYALAENQNGQKIILNINSEFRIVFPKKMESIKEKVTFLFEEIIRIVDLNPSIKMIAIRESEYTRYPEDDSKRFSKNLDGVIMAVAAHKNIPFTKKVMQSLKVKKSNLMEAAEAISGKTKTYWNEDIAETIMAAISEL